MPQSDASMDEYTRGNGVDRKTVGGSPRASGAVSTTDTWLVQKLKNEWSSCDLGPLLTRDRISEAVTSFSHLDTPIKVRLLLSFLSMRKEDFDENKLAIVEIIDAAERDNEEWVKIGAGIVNQYLFMTRDGTESDTFLHDQLASASAKVIAAVNGTRDGADVLIIEDFFCHENAYLSASVRPELAVKPAAHFTLAESARDTKKTDASKVPASSAGVKSIHRPPIPRSHGTQSATATSSSSAASALRTSSHPAAKPPPALAAKKNMSELSSEIRRKADAGRFKRQRSRISVIDLDEVKQIESEKAQKAEEQKKRLKATKEERKATGSGNGGQNEGTGNGTGTSASGNGDKHHDDGGGAGDDEDGHIHESQYSEHDDHHDSEREDHDDGYRVSQEDSNTASANAGAYTQDGTQALLHAAFHSTGDVMKEVVSHQHHGGYYHQQQSTTQQSLFNSRGFEPEDAHSSGLYGSTSGGYGYGSSGYGSQLGDHGGPAYNNEASHHNQYGDDNSPTHQSSSSRYDSHRYMDGPPPDLWR